MSGVKQALLAGATACVLIAIPYALPGLDRFQLLTPLAPGEGLTLAPPAAESTVVGETELPAVASAANTHLRIPEQVELPKRARKLVDEAKPPVSIEGPDSALTSFFTQLERVENDEPASLVRVAAWGDSNVASDLVTSVLRRALQKRFGDGGHGFVLLTRASKNYFHNDVRQIAAGGWGMSRMTQPLAQDGIYGLGGTTFRSIGRGAFARIGTAGSGTFGRACSRIVIDYLEQPDGGAFEVRIDGELKETVATEGATSKGRLATYRVADGEHELEIRSVGPDARIFGVWLERDGPGAVVDALGVTNSKIRYLLRMDEAFFADQITLRDPHLLMLNFGVNGAREGRTLWGGEERYENDVRDVLARLRKHHPDRSCLVVSPGDAAAPFGNEAVSFPLVPTIVALQKRAAIASGCAFWNMHQAMGGDGSMAEWKRAGLGKPDLLHPTNAGATLLGRWLYLALMERFRAFKTESR